MTFSKPLLATDKKKTTLNWFEYILFSCIQQGWMNCWYSFQNWADLMGNNYAEYALLKDDDPLDLCILYFWDSLEEDIYPKDFLEYLMQMVDDVETGKIRTYSMEDVMVELAKDCEEFGAL
jgi:hypothetical protein